MDGCWAVDGWDSGFIFSLLCIVWVCVLLPLWGWRPALPHFYIFLWLRKNQPTPPTMELNPVFCEYWGSFGWQTCPTPWLIKSLLILLTSGFCWFLSLWLHMLLILVTEWQNVPLPLFWYHHEYESEQQSWKPCPSIWETEPKNIGRALTEKARLTECLYRAVHQFVFGCSLLYFCILSFYFLFTFLF